MYPTDLSTCELTFAPEKAPSSLLHRINRACTALFLGSLEPQIVKVNADNETLNWNVYDPNTDRTYTFASESEVRVWIESRYNH